MGNIEALLNYQEAELNIERLESKTRSSSAGQTMIKLRKTLRELQLQKATLEKQVEEMSETIDGLHVQHDVLKERLKLEEEDLAIMESDENCTAEEAFELHSSLRSIKAEMDVLRKKLIDDLDQFEKAERSLGETLKKGGKLKKEYDEIKVICDAEHEAARPEIEASKKKLEQLKSKVPELLMKRYIMLKKNFPIPTAKVENGKCTGCNVSLPSSITTRVARGDVIATCEHCGRILYI
ncbi:MAG: C4-type zinc ribbon domain-containing protein [Clostridia bacterium]